MSAIMTSRQAAELDYAFERNRWTSEDVKKLSQGNILIQVLSVIKGYAEVRILKHVIDCKNYCYTPHDGCRVQKFRKGGLFQWDPKKVELQVFSNGKSDRYIARNEIQEEIESKPVLNANVLAYLLLYPKLIPDEWRGKNVHFPGTIYYINGLSDVMLYLCEVKGRWAWLYTEIKSCFWSEESVYAVMKK
ncbi:MAG: hypothetical protein U1D31_02780 [Patescibacteria group bacterium]|nr:hypothetical protein [bacterium]MDZ4241017.1 hypothetical protein [Patescibacteria group bacterium]